MTGTVGIERSWTDEDTELLFANIGKYLVIFQHIETRLDQILLLAWGYESKASSRARLANMNNEKKIEAVRSEVKSSPKLARVHTRPDWLENFEATIQRLHVERKLRNRLVHSHILFEFTEIGLPPLASKRSISKGKATLSQLNLDKEFMKNLMDNIAKLAWDVGFIHGQLVHDYEASEY